MIGPGIGLLVAGVAGLARDGVAAYRTTASSQWQSVPGHITSSAIDVQRTTYVRVMVDSWLPVVQYEYSVHGTKYQGNTLSFVRSYQKKDALAIKNEYQPGRIVRVYYSPSHPRQSVLLPGGPVKLAALIMEAAVGLGGLALLAFATASG